MLRLNCFFDLTGLKAFYAYPDALRGPVDERAHELKVWQESADVDTGYLLSDTAFFPC